MAPWLRTLLYAVLALPALIVLHFRLAVPVYRAIDFASTEFRAVN
jgi:hypothetical protein